MRYFTKERRVLKAVGISFSGDESIAYKIYSALIIFCANFMYLVLEIRELFKQDMEVISSMLLYVFGNSVALVKTIVVLQNRIQIGKILKRLEEEPFIVNLQRGGMQEEELNKTCVWITNTQTLVYWTLIITAVSSTTGYALIMRIISDDPANWKLVIGTLTVLNITYSPNYEITWLYQSISYTSMAFHFCTIDLLMAGLLTHISYQFKMVQNTTRRVVKNSYREEEKDKNALAYVQPRSAETEVSFNIDSSVISWKYLHKHLKGAVQYHLEITNLAKEMEIVFSKLLLMIFVGTLGMLCFTIYLSSVSKDRVKTLIHLQEAVSTCIQVFIVCYWGEQVVFESQNVSRAAYEANFVGADLRFQKGLVLIIRRSQNSTKLTAGKFTDICLSTFTWIVRTSYSAFMVLKSTALNEM